MNLHIRNENQRTAVMRQIQNFPLGELGFDVDIKPHEETRTLQQNKFMWTACYKPIAAFMSEHHQKVITPEHVHQVCRDMFAEKVTNPITGNVHPKSTTQMKKAELNDYLEQCFAWGADMGVFFE